ESILDKLVSAPESQHPTPAEPAAAKTVKPVETAESRPDEQLLDKLTEPVKPTEPKPVVKTEPIGAEPDEFELHGQGSENILDRLTGRLTPQKKINEKNNKSQGEVGDA
ncbi:MAG: hypothetical protein ACYS4W_10185, partial [Planctomycetota bacterium]